MNSVIADLDQIGKKVLLVTKAKEMINYYSQFKLKPLQLKLIDLVIAFINPSSTSIQQVTFSSELLCKHLGMVTANAPTVKQFHMNKKVKDLCASLMGSDTTVTGKSTLMKQKPWFDEVEIHNSGEVTITLCSKLSEFLLINKNLGNLFHTYSLDCVQSLNQREAILLYMLLHSVHKCNGGMATFTIDEIKNKLCLRPDSKNHAQKSEKNGEVTYFDSLGNKIGSSMDTPRNFKRLVLGQAIDLINTQTNIFVRVTSLPNDVPDTMKTHLSFVVTANPNFASKEPEAHPRKKQGFIENDLQKIEALKSEELSQLEALKHVIRVEFGSESSDYIKMIDQRYSIETPLEDISLRCQWLIKLKTFLNHHGSTALLNTVKVNAIKPGLFSFAFTKKKDSSIRLDISQLDAYQPPEIRIADIARPSSMSELEPIKRTAVENLVKIALNEYMQHNKGIWDTKILNLDTILIDDVSLTQQIINNIQFLKRISTTKIGFIWCAFSIERDSTKEGFIPTISRVQDYLTQELKLESSKIKGSFSRAIQQNVEELLMLKLKEAAKQAADLK